MKKRLSICLAGLLLCGCAVTQDQNTPVAERYQINPVTGRGFYLYVPSDYSHDRPWPLIVSCHGTPPYDVAAHHIRELKMLCEKNGCIVVAPELLATDGIIGDGPIIGMLANESHVLSLVSLMCYRYNIDRANVMLTGFSGGGFPTYWIGLRHPEVFSTLVSRSGNFSEGNVAGWFDPLAARGLQVKVYHGENDPGAIVSQSTAAVSYLRSIGLEVQTEILPGRGHERVPEVAMRFFQKNLKPPRPSLSQE